MKFVDTDYHFTYPAFSVLISTFSQAFLTICIMTKPSLTSSWGVNMFSVHYTLKCSNLVDVITSIFSLFVFTLTFIEEIPLM